MKIIKSFEKIEKREILDCRIKSLKEQLNFYGYELNSLEIFILCEAITFRYGKIDYKEQSIFNLPYITSTNMNIHELIFNKLDIKYNIEEISDDETGIDKFKYFIDNQIPVLVELDGSIFMKRKKEHWTDLHYISYVLVVGYNDEKRSFTMVLTQSAESNTCISLGYDEFQKARMNEIFPYRLTGKCYCILTNNNFKNTNIEIMLRNSLRNIAYNMINGKVDECIKSYNIEIHDIYVGLHGMKKFIADYIIKSHQILKNKNIKTQYQLELLLLRNNMLYGTMSCYRNELKMSLQLLYKKYNFLECKKPIKYMENSIKMWKKLILLINAISRDKNKISWYSLRSISSVMKKIYIQEKKAYCLLLKL